MVIGGEHLAQTERSSSGQMRTLSLSDGKTRDFDFAEFTADRAGEATDIDATAQRECPVSTRCHLGRYPCGGESIDRIAITSGVQSFMHLLKGCSASVTATRQCSEFGKPRLLVT
jgi:hypothetical protein